MSDDTPTRPTLRYGLPSGELAAVAVESAALATRLRELLAHATGDPTDTAAVLLHRELHSATVSLGRIAALVGGV